LSSPPPESLPVVSSPVVPDVDDPEVVLVSPVVVPVPVLVPVVLASVAPLSSVVPLSLASPVVPVDVDVAVALTPESESTSPLPSLSALVDPLDDPELVGLVACVGSPVAPSALVEPADVEPSVSSPRPT
jgi:hypothetical protein